MDAQAEISGTEKKRLRGRPVGSGGPPTMHVRLPLASIEAVDAWSARQPDTPSRPEALRRLLDKALSRE